MTTAHEEELAVLEDRLVTDQGERLVAAKRRIGPLRELVEAERAATVETAEADHTEVHRAADTDKPKPRKAAAK